jgi:colanic acid/amylovoran biosynthesis glycosyltransferase
VVATRHGALPEGMADGESGFLVPERDAAAMAATLVRLAEECGRWPAMGQAGRAFVAARYDTRLLNRRLVELYQTVLAEYHSKSRHQT